MPIKSEVGDLPLTSAATEDHNIPKRTHTSTSASSNQVWLIGYSWLQASTIIWA